MAYVLEKMTLEDKNKIFTDLELDPKKKQLVIAYKLFEFFDRVNWAVDRKSNSYIILAPISLEHPLDHKFYFFIRKIGMRSGSKPCLKMKSILKILSQIEKNVDKNSEIN